MTAPPRSPASTTSSAPPPRGGKTRHGPRQPIGGLRLRDIVAGVGSIVPPVWPLEDFVAVNPFVGLSAARFLDARGLLRDVRDCEMLPAAGDFLGRFGQGDITIADVGAAVAQCREEYPELYGDLGPQAVVEALQEAAALATPPRGEATARGGAGETERRYLTVSEAIDRRQGSSWSSHVVTEISRLLAAHYDRGQAAWPSPFRHLPLYEAWRELSRSSRRMEMLGIRGFRRFVAELPTDPDAAVEHLLDRLGIPEEHWRPFLLCQLFSIAGWASFLRYRFWQAEAADADGFDEHVGGLLAMRLAYDVALAEMHPAIAGTPGSIVPDVPTEEVMAPLPVSRSALARYAFQVAAEKAYERELTAKLRGRAPVAMSTVRKTLQMIFCIDVRSEVFRRHLEASGNSLQTFGFAGFFAMPLEFVPLASAHGPAQCPALLTPGFRVHERLRGVTVDDAVNTAVIGRRRQVRLGRRIWKAFQTSATSCFSFVESLGLAYLPKLLTDSLGWTRPVMKAQGDGLGGRPVALLGPDLDCGGPDALAPERKVDLAAGMLRNLGLTTDFARIVVVCGHASEVVNNPSKASLDCGACGGHSGEPNARVAAGLLNDPVVRAGLAARGIEIPTDTWFAPAVHVTTTDEIRFFDIDSLPADHADEFATVQRWLDRAGAATRRERTRRLGDAAVLGGEADILRRSRDWSEVRPEWGLAGNAAFIVAPRWRTTGLDLGGRTFLHDYDHSRDPKLQVLELIMTAPMIVTSWINLQYFASAVDNRGFGSGNKQIHNVTGQLGVLLGNGGDLMTGLSWQAVSDGERLQHEPLRLLVLIEAPRAAVRSIVEKHAQVRDLVSNGWLRLVVREGDSFMRWTAGGAWEPVRA